MSKFFTGLWRNSDFRKFWAGETVSLFGNQITTLALPLVAVLTLNATPEQMGYLNASQYLPYILITLFAGVWIDRRRRRPLMIFANIGRAVFLGFVPLSYVLGFLHIQYLFLIAFLAGVLTVIFELSYQSYLPTLIDRTELVEGNGKMAVSQSLAQVAGPGIAGLLVGALSAPFAILINALSFMVSTFTLSIIKKPESKVQLDEQRKPIFKEIGSGIRIIVSNPYIRAICGEASTYNFFYTITWAVMVLYLTHDLHIGPKLLGFIMTSGSIGSLLGSLVAGKLGKIMGTGPVILWSMVIGCGAPILVPWVSGSMYVVAPVLVLSFFIGFFGLVISNVHVISLRQAIVPPEVLGRANASYRFICSSTTPVGSLVGGWLGASLGLHATLWIGAVGSLTALIWLYFSPVRTVREIPTEPLPFLETRKAEEEAAIS